MKINGEVGNIGPQHIFRKDAEGSKASNVKPLHSRIEEAVTVKINSLVQDENILALRNRVSDTKSAERMIKLVGAQILDHPNTATLAHQVIPSKVLSLLR